MSESANLMPFVCKWLGTHSDPQHFETEEKLRKHIVQHDINSCNKSIPGNPIYICPWEGCNKYQSSIIKLEEHLRRHIQQRPFKCPICNRSRFDSSDGLSQHLIINHNGSVVDPDTDDDTLYYENEEFNLRKAEDKNDVHVKKVNKDKKDEIMPISNTANLSYRDVLVKGKAEVQQTSFRNQNQNFIKKEIYKNDVHVIPLGSSTSMRKEVSKDKKDETMSMSNTAILSYRVKGRDSGRGYYFGGDSEAPTDKQLTALLRKKSDINENENAEDLISKQYDHDQSLRDLMYKGMEAISLSPTKKIAYEYDLDTKYFDDLPDVPKLVLSRAEEDKLILESLCRAYKGSKAAEYFEKAYEILERRP